MKTFLNDFKFVFHVILHPFDGFYSARFNRKKNYFVIAIIYILCGFTEVLRINYSGFVIRTWNVNNYNNAFVFLAAVFPYFLFAVSNWSVTTLFNGNGRLSDIIMVLAYAMCPKIIVTLLGILISNFIIAQEVAILNAFLLIGTLIFVFIAFAGLCVIHEYSAAKTVGMAVATVFAALIIVFLMLFYVSVMEKIITFILTAAKELLNKIAM